MVFWIKQTIDTDYTYFKNAFLTISHSSLSDVIYHIQTLRLTTFTVSVLFLKLSDATTVASEIQYHGFSTILPHLYTRLRPYLDKMFPGKWIGRVGPIAWRQIWHRQILEGCGERSADANSLANTAAAHQKAANKLGRDILRRMCEELAIVGDICRVTKGSHKG